MESVRPTRWVLTFVGDGHKAILTTTEPLARETYEHVRAMWEKWVSTDGELMVIGDCRIERTGQVELDINANAIIVRKVA